MTAARRAIGVTAPAGFVAAGVACGIRNDHLDLALVVSETEASAAAVFTRNLVQAAPVVLSRQALESSGGRAQAIVVNSGNANACTGERGMDDARKMVDLAAAVCGAKADEALVMSTGIIGEFLPMDKICSGIEAAAQHLSREYHADAMEAIMTTDTQPKEYAVEIETPQGTFRIGGMA